MCTHAGPIGTSRPTHYHVLLDEIGFSADNLQKLLLPLSYVSFWGANIQMGISIANIADFAKPPEKISYSPQVVIRLSPWCYAVPVALTQCSRTTILLNAKGSESCQEAHGELPPRTTEGAIHCSKAQFCRPYGETC